MKALLISSKNIEPNTQEINIDEIFEIDLKSRQVLLINRLVITEVGKIVFKP